MNTVLGNIRWHYVYPQQDNWDDLPVPAEFAQQQLRSGKHERHAFLDELWQTSQNAM